MFPLRSLTKEEIKAGFNLFRAETGIFTKCFCCNCNSKLFGNIIKRYLASNQSDIIHVAAGRQSSNGLVESHRKTMVHISRTYLTKKQVPRWFWFYSNRHPSQMMNHIPAKYNDKLASPFMLAHGIQADCQIWLLLFLVCYFHHDTDGSTMRSKNQAQTMNSIIVGRCPDLNEALVYNPRNKNFYWPDSYCIDPY